MRAPRLSPGRAALVAWAINEARKPREVSARVEEVAAAEGVRPATVWRAVCVALEAAAAAARDALRIGRAPPLPPGSAAFLRLAGPAVGQGRPRIMGGRAAGHGLSSEWGRARAVHEWLNHPDQPLIVDDFEVAIVVTRPRARLCKPDLDNVVKLHLDALVAAGVVSDDSRCRALSARVLAGPEGVTVTVTACP